MIERRKLVQGALAAGATTLAGMTAATPAAAQGTDTQLITRAIDEMRRTIKEELDPSRGIEQIRMQQRTFLRSAQKFPDYIDVGINVWDQLLDWHVKHQQPLAVSRMADGRYGMTFQLTTLVLRPDQAENYVSFGYDNRKCRSG